MIRCGDCQAAWVERMAGTGETAPPGHLPDAVPAADVVEVVRCKDCAYRDGDGFCSGRGWPMLQVPADGYCDKGKLKKGEDDYGK